MKKSISLLLGASLLSVSIMASNAVNTSLFTNLPLFKNKNIKIIKAVDRDSYYQIKALNNSNGRELPLNIFVTKDLKTLFIGKAFNAKNMKEITIPINMQKYKKDAAFTFGNGKDEYIVFTDPECPFCKRFEKQWNYLKDKVKFYVYLFPLSFHQHARKMSLYILSQPKEKRMQALEDISLKNDQSFKKVDKYSKEKLSKLNKILQFNMQTGIKLGVNGTPTVYDMRGNSIGWPSIAKRLNVKVPVDVNALNFLVKKKAALEFGDKGSPIYIFTDLDCPFCQGEYKSGKLKDLTKNHKVYIFLFPLERIHPNSFAKTVLLWSKKTDKERKKLFDRFMRGSELTKEEKKITDDIIKNKKSKISEKILMTKYIANRIGVRGTPTIYNDKGEEIR